MGAAWRIFTHLLRRDEGIDTETIGELTWRSLTVLVGITRTMDLFFRARRIDCAHITHPNLVSNSATLLGNVWRQ